MDTTEQPSTEGTPQNAVPTPAVLIVGAGPVGLVAACELLQQGHPVRIIERRASPNIPENGQSRAILVWPRVLEQLQRIGVSHQIVARGHLLPSVEYYSEGVVRGVARMDKLDDTPHPYVVTIAQNDTEDILLKRVNELGGFVDYSSTLTALDSTEAGALAEIQSANGTDVESFRWVVAAGGAGGRVREMLGIEFKRDPLDMTYVIGDFPIDGHVPQTVQYRYSKQGIVVIVPLKDGLFRVAANAPHRQPGEIAPPDELFHELVSNRGKLDVRLGPSRWTSSFRPKCGSALTYRAGSCFIAGDAAHVVSPAGGQGMNLGIQDAISIGWRLGGVLSGWLDQSTLEDYSPERIAAAEVVGSTSAVQVKLGTMKGDHKILARDRAVQLATTLGLLQRVAAPLLSQIIFSHNGTGAEKLLTRLPWKKADVGDRLPIFAGASIGNTSVELALDRYTVLVTAPDERTTTHVVDRLRERLADLPVEILQLHSKFGRINEKLSARIGHQCVAVVRPDGHLALRVALSDVDSLEAYLRNHTHALSPARHEPPLATID